MYRKSRRSANNIQDRESQDIILKRKEVVSKKGKSGKNVWRKKGDKESRAELAK